MKVTTLYLRGPRSTGRRKPCRWLPRSMAYYRLTLRNGVGLVLCWQPFYGIYPLAITPRDSLGMRDGDWFQKPEKAVKKKNQATSLEGPRQHLAAMESNLFSRMVPLVEHMACTRYDDGDARVPGWITVKTQGSAWQVQVKDPDSASSFVAVANSLDDALALASLLLEAEETPWEHDKWLADKKPRGKK